MRDYPGGSDYVNYGEATEEEAHVSQEFCSMSAMPPSTDKHGLKNFENGTTWHLYDKSLLIANAPNIIFIWVGRKLP